MQDRSRAAATALCSGMSDSRLASAAATTGLRQAGSAKGIPFSGSRDRFEQRPVEGKNTQKDSVGFGHYLRMRGSRRGDLAAWNSLSAGDLDRSAPDSRWRRRRRGTRMPWILAMENGDEENRVNA